MQPRLLDEYCDPLDLKKTVSDGTELLGAIAPTPAIEDDYSVPYEVKKILKGNVLDQFYLLILSVK